VRRAEFVQKVKQYGAKSPDLSHNGWYADHFGWDRPGYGFPLNYTEQDVRLVVAWHRVNELLGSSGHAGIAETAMNEMVEHEDGWLVITEGMVGWVSEPHPSLFNTGAALIPILW
jgi:hypothetical protein